MLNSCIYTQILYKDFILFLGIAVVLWFYIKDLKACMTYCSSNNQDMYAFQLHSFCSLCAQDSGFGSMHTGSSADADKPPVPKVIVLCCIYMHTQYVDSNAKTLIDVFLGPSEAILQRVYWNCMVIITQAISTRYCSISNLIITFDKEVLIRNNSKH